MQPPRRRQRQAFVVGAAITAVLVTPMAAHAGGVAEGDCRLSDTQFLPGEPGWSQSLSQVCGGNSAWQAEASYYWTDEKLVIIEPREGAFDYSAFSQLNPFTGDGYSFRKANELFPDTSSATAAYEKLTYTTAALGAKPRAIQSRNGDLAADTCSAVPSKYSETQLQSGDYWLAPAPRAGGPTGTYTYDLSPGLSAEQRSVVLDALVQFDAARAGTSMPRLVPRAPGDTSPATMTFEDGSTDPEFGDDTGSAVLNTSDTGRNGLKRWLTGAIELTRDLSMLNARTVVHEIAHVYGYDDTTDLSLSSTMSSAPSGQGRGVWQPWQIDKNGPPEGVVGVDSCLKKAFQTY